MRLQLAGTKMHIDMNTIHILVVALFGDMTVIIIRSQNHE